MIGIEDENLIPIRDVPRQIPPRRSGRRVHVSAVYRWMSRGVRGVRLESIKIGGTTYTSTEAIQRFAERLSGQERQPSQGALTKSRRKRIDDAARQVDAIFGEGPAKGATP
jgi:hypothetical protein